MKELQMIIIGIVEDSKKRTTFKLLKEIFTMFGYTIYYENKFESMAVLNKGETNIMIVDIKSDSISSIENIGFEFNILIHTFLNPKGYEKQNLRRLFSQSDYIIINCDEEKWTYLLNNNKPIVITYGFNNKATINPSSYNIHDLIEANICFQRAIKRIDGTIIEPFELPIKIYSREKLDIYSVIVCIASGLLLGIDKFSLHSFMTFNTKIVNGEKKN